MNESKKNKTTFSKLPNKTSEQADVPSFVSVFFAPKPLDFREREIFTRWVFKETVVYPGYPGYPGVPKGTLG